MGGCVSEPAEPLADVELELLDQRSLRTWDADEVWETFRGKSNRISIGRPTWTREPQRAAMKLDLTLLPDLDCRFANAELALRLEAAAPTGQAIVTRLEPDELGDEAVVVQETTGGLKASLGETVVPVGGELGRSTVRREQANRILVRLAAFGAGTHEAGWRLSMTNARDIPLNTTGLTATIAHPPQWSGTIWFSVVAQIQVRSRTDRWLTAAFGLGDRARLRCSQAFPP